VTGTCYRRHTSTSAVKSALTILHPQLDKLVISQLGFLAQRRLARGVRLNHAEAAVWISLFSHCAIHLGGLSRLIPVQALISSNLQEVSSPHPSWKLDIMVAYSQQLIRDGHYSVADLMSIGKTMLGRRHVLPSVVHTLVELQVEGTFPTGTYLVTVHHPISSDDGDLEKALYGSFLPIPPADTFPDPNPDDYLPEKMPGAVLPVKNERITLNDGRKRIRLKVMSKGDRPIQVRSLPFHRHTRNKVFDCE
jgi:urease